MLSAVLGKGKSLVQAVTRVFSQFGVTIAN
ncbi:MAG: hypothetical protein ACI8U1_002385 [Rheinheimera aquimaris]